ncbi:hypothetical protein ACMFMG_008441 [Clarireedia jacksonii]
MSASPPDQTALMQEILDSIKNLQVNQVQLASNVDAITGRVNVLAGMKEVRDVAATGPTTTSEPSTSVPKSGESLPKDEHVPLSPSLPAAKLDAEIPIPSSPQKASTSTGTSRIILT